MKKLLITFTLAISCCLLSLGFSGCSLFGGSVSSLEKFMDSADNTFTNYIFEENYGGTTTYTREGQFTIGSGSGAEAYNGKLIKYYGTSSKYDSSTVWLLDSGNLTIKKYSYDAVKSSETKAYDITTDSSSDIHDLYRWSDVTNFISLNGDGYDYSVKKTTEDSTVTYTVEATWESDSSGSSIIILYTLVYTEGDDGTYAITSAVEQFDSYVVVSGRTINATSYKRTLTATDATLTYSF